MLHDHEGRHELQRHVGQRLIEPAVFAAQHRIEVHDRVAVLHA